MACVCIADEVRTVQPSSLKAPPKPSHFWAAEVSLTVTVAVPVVTVVAVAVVQYAPGAEVITFIVTAVPPVPGDPPVAAPPVPVGAAGAGLSGHSAGAGRPARAGPAAGAGSSRQCRW